MKWLQPWASASGALVLLSLLSGPSGASLATTLPNDTRTSLPAFQHKPRVFILSDILNEVDDSESLVRYLLYSNEFDTQGICAVTSEWLPNATYPGAMRDILEAYGEVVDNLNHHVNPGAQYPNASALLSLVTSGPRVCLPPFCLLLLLLLLLGADIETNLGRVAETKSRCMAGRRYPSLQVKGLLCLSNASKNHPRRCGS